MLSAQLFSQIKSSFITYEREAEVEFRFGSFFRGTFRGGVDKRTFDRFLATFSALPRTEESVEDFIQGNIRKRVLLARPEKEESTSWISKEVIHSFDSPLYPFRLSISRERKVQPPANFRYTLLRRKHRFSYLLTGGLFRLDLTRVEEINKRESKSRLEIELEVLSPSFTEEQLKKTLVFVLSLLLETNYLYSEEEKEELLRKVNHALGGRNPNLSRVDPGVLVQTRNLKLEDLVWGGLLGNPQTTYRVTHKADGLRKLLVVDRRGLWLIMPPTEVNLVKTVTDPDIVGAILDGEFIPPESRTSSLPKSKYWFLAFDCLSFPLPGAKAFNPTVQERDHNYRMRCCQIVADRNKDETLYVNTKSFFDFHNPETFYKRMRDMFAEQPTLGYKEDGFIFTPLNMPYNPDSEKFSIRERVLSAIPDNVKWKPPHLLTIDLTIRWKATRKGERTLEVFTSERGELVPFRGDKRNSLAGVEIDGLEGVPTNSVVEFQVNPGENVLLPLRVREKTRPNRKEVALDIWKDAHSPLSEETLRGDDFILVRRYHNNIKRDLLASLPEGSILLDLGSGRGADVSKWRKFKLVVAVEPSGERLEELLRRAKTVGANNIITLQAKAEETEKILNFLDENVPGGKVDAVAMLLSMTFFWESREILDGVIQTTKKAMKPGGTLLFFTINGRAVEEVFNPRRGIPLLELHLGKNSLTYHPEEKRLTLYFPGTIIENQTEPLAFLEDLMLDFDLEIFIADKEKFLTPEESIFSRLYSYGKGKIRREEEKRGLEPLPLELDLANNQAKGEEETYEFTLSWSEEKVFRLPSLPGQTPFFAYFKAFSPEYREGGLKEKFTLVTQARRELAYQLPSYYSGLNKGSLQDLSLVNPKIFPTSQFTLDSIQELLTSHASLPLYLYPYLAEFFRTDLYLLREEREGGEGEYKVLPYFYTEEAREAVLLLQIGESIELVAVEREGELVTFLPLEDPLLIEFRTVLARR